MTSILAVMSSDAEKLSQIVARESRATKGPWDIRLVMNYQGVTDLVGAEICSPACVVAEIRGAVVVGGAAHIENAANMAFLLHAREDIPWLLSQLRAQKERIEELEGRAEPPGEDRMWQIDKLIAELQEIRKWFGNTCVYIRRYGVAWGAAALNYRADDEKHGVFDLEAEYQRRLVAHNEQVERLKAERDYWMAKSPTLMKGEGK